MQSLNINSLIKKTKYHRPLVFNGVLWSLAFVVLLFVFAKGKSPITVDYIYTLIFLSALAIPVVINFYIIIPKFLKQEKYLIYFAIFIINLLVFALLSSWLLQPILDTLFPNYFFYQSLLTCSLSLLFILIQQVFSRFYPFHSRFMIEFTKIFHYIRGSLR